MGGALCRLRGSVSVYLSSLRHSVLWSPAALVSLTLSPTSTTQGVGWTLSGFPQGSRLGEIVGPTSLASHLSRISVLPCLKSSVLTKIVSYILAVFCCCFKEVGRSGFCYCILGRSKAFYITLTICSYFGRNMKDRYPNLTDSENELCGTLSILTQAEFSEVCFSLLLLSLPQIEI